MRGTCQFCGGGNENVVHVVSTLRNWHSQLRGAFGWRYTNGYACTTCCKGALGGGWVRVRWYNAWRARA